MLFFPLKDTYFGEKGTLENITQVLRVILKII